MLRTEVVELEGIVHALQPSDRYSVVTDDGQSVLAMANTRLAREAIPIRVGDRVTLRLDLDQPTPGLITYRYKNGSAEHDRHDGHPQR
jgi:translation initiation factor IF-1